MTTNKEKEAFEAWAEQSGNLALFFNGVANPQAKNGWMARVALDMSDELAEVLEEMIAMPTEGWTIAECMALHKKALEVLTKYRSMKGEWV